MLSVHSWQKKGPHRTCEDSFRILPTEDGVILAVADGHGKACYVRAGLGARFACAAAVKRLKQGISPEEFPAAVKDDFDRMVDKHLRFHPPADWETEWMNGIDPRHAYGTTLLAAYVTDSQTHVFQIGDGAIHTIGIDGCFFPQLSADASCKGTATSSLVQERQYVLDHFRTATYPACAGVMLFTDGYKCSGRPKAAAKAMADLSAMEQILRKGERGDDQTFLLAVRPDVVTTDAFAKNLDAQIEIILQEEAHARMLHKADQDFWDIFHFLEHAPETEKYLTETNDPKLTTFREVVAQKQARMNALFDLLNSQPVPTT